MAAKQNPQDLLGEVRQVTVGALTGQFTDAQIQALSIAMTLAVQAVVDPAAHAETVNPPDPPAAEEGPDDGASLEDTADAVAQ